MGSNYTVNASTGLITTAGGVDLPTAGGTASTLDYYEKYTQNIRFESDTFGAGVYLTIAFRFTRIGNVVYVNWNTNNQSMASGTGNDNLTTLAGDEFPSRFRPTLATLNLPIRVHNNGSNTSGTMNIDTSGGVTVGLNNFYTIPFVFNAGSQNLIYAGNAVIVLA